MNDFALSKSSRLVLDAIISGKVTQGEILNETDLSERTIRYVISKLKLADLILEINSVRDARRRKYFWSGKNDL